MGSILGSPYFGKLLFGLDDGPCLHRPLASTPEACSMLTSSGTCVGTSTLSGWPAVATKQQKRFETVSNLGLKRLINALLRKRHFQPQAIRYEDPLPCKSGTIELEEDLDIILVITHSR